MPIAPSSRWYKAAVAESGDPTPTPVVMKFGGSSVADDDRLQIVVERILERARRQPVVVVVSAMGKTTDQLVETARSLCDPPPARELDMLLSTGERHSMARLALALHGHGLPAISLTGSQCGIITDHRHGRARVVEVRPFRILDELSSGHGAVIVGGFQGVSYKREVTTLGRGGSDTTAVALAAALGADCEIYSDVDGVYSADPRVVDGALRIEDLDAATMQAMARGGARVLHARAVQMAADAGIAIYARATDGRSGETVVRTNRARPRLVRAVACDRDVWIVRARTDQPLEPADLVHLLDQVAEAGLRFVDAHPHGLGAVLSRTQVDDADASLERLRQALARLPGLDVSTEQASLVSAIGAQLEDEPAILREATRVLQEGEIGAWSLFTDGHTLAFAVRPEHGAETTRRLHDALVVPTDA